MRYTIGRLMLVMLLASVAWFLFSTLTGVDWWKQVFLHFAEPFRLWAWVLGTDFNTGVDWDGRQPYFGCVVALTAGAFVSPILGFCVVATLCQLVVHLWKATAAPPRDKP